MNPTLGMKLAILGDDPRAMPLLRAWLATVRDDQLATTPLIAAIESPNCLAALRREGLTSDVATDVRVFANGLVPDALIVASDEPRILDLARQLATSGSALLVLPLAGITTAFPYELTLLQTDTGVVLTPLFTWRDHPLVQRVRELLERGALGNIQHVQLDRKVLLSSSGDGLSTRRVAADFLEDIDLLRLLTGEVGSVSAVRSALPGGEILLQTVSLGPWSKAPIDPYVSASKKTSSGEAAGARATWSIMTGPEQDSWRLSIAADAGRVTLHGIPGTNQLTCEVTGVACENSPAVKTSDPGQAWLERLQGLRNQPATEVADAWGDFTRAYEVLEGVERSIRRRRTIDLEFELPSEQSQFKTHMSAVGCSLLVLTLLAVVAYLVIAQAFFPVPRELRDSKVMESLTPQEQEVSRQQLESRQRVQRIVLSVIFLPLGIFLVLQLLLFVTRPAGKPQSGVPPDDPGLGSKEKQRRP